MNQVEFDNQINRLRDCFGDRAYSDERAKLIWNSCQSFDTQWFRRLVDGMISTEKHAPLPAAFYDAASQERERLYLLEKEQQKNDAQNFYSSYGAEDLAGLCREIKRRASGGMSDQDFSSFVKLLQTSPAYERHCKLCEGEGYVFIKQDGFEYAYHCRCKEGSLKPKAIPLVPVEYNLNK